MRSQLLPVLVDRGDAMDVGLRVSLEVCGQRQVANLRVRQHLPKRLYLMLRLDRPHNQTSHTKRQAQNLELAQSHDRRLYKMRRVGAWRLARPRSLQMTAPLARLHRRLHVAEFLGRLSSFALCPDAGIPVNARPR